MEGPSRNRSKMGETCNKGKEKMKEDQCHTFSSNYLQVKRKNKEVAAGPHMDIGSYSQYFGFEDSDFDYDYGYGYVYGSDSDFSYDDYTNPFRFAEDGNYLGDYSQGDDFFSYSSSSDHDEEEDKEVGRDDDITDLIAIAQKDEDEQVERPLNMGVMSKLPSDVVFDILSRLPLKTLASCRSVCKDMCRITHLRRFIKMHHNRAIQGDIPPSLLLHGPYYSDGDIYLLQHDTHDDTVDGRAVVVNPPCPPKNEFEVVGSCNGLLCLSECSCPRFVCNPVTGEYICLPYPDKQSDLDIVSGFGYDEVANEYKVVRMLFHSIDFGDSIDSGDEDGTPSFKLEGELYSLSLGKWKDIGDVPYPLHGKASSAFVNGALHWMTDDCGDSLNVPELIVSFDLGREEFQVVPPPSGFVLGWQSPKVNLGVLGGNLCLFNYSIDRHLEIWIMKKYGVKGSWIKEYVISQEGLGQDSGHFIPLRLMNGGELLLSYKGECLVFYDPVTKKFRDIQIRRLPRHFVAITHAGSLLPLRNAIGLAKRDRFNFSFNEWCSTFFQIPARESMMNGDKQRSEHGPIPYEEVTKDFHVFKRPEGWDRLQREEGASNADKMFGEGMNTCGRKSRGSSVRGRDRRRGRGGGSGRGGGGERGSGSVRGRGRGRGKGKGKGRGGSTFMEWRVKDSKT